LKTQPSLAELLFPNQYRRKVLALLLMQPDQKVHLRELARQTQAAPGTLKKELDALCAVGLLRSERVGNQVHFQANPAHPVFAELQALVRKTTGLADVLRQAPLGCEINPKVMTTAGWAAKQSEANPLVQELLAKPQILLIGTLNA
jgi:hypothetical protein